MSKKIMIFDTTLRDGEQSPGCSMNLQEKLTFAQQLAALGVDIIEAGFAVASPGDFEAVQAIADSVRGVCVASLSRALEKDIATAWQAIRGAERPRIHTFLATSPIHMQYKLKMKPDEVLAQIDAMVRYARSLCPDVEFSAEDASRSEPEFLARVVETAIKAGARTINLPDTVGYAIPTEYAALVNSIRERVPSIDKAILSVHCHNDLGLGVANSLAAISAGATQVECTINGIGERAGNAALEEIVMALRTRGEFLDAHCDIDTAQIYKTSRLLSSITGVKVQPNKAIVGENAFAHEAGIHQHGVLANRATYEIMTPESIGLPQNKMVLGKHSGRHAFEERLKSLGLAIAPAQMPELFEEFKRLADKKKTVGDRDIEALALGKVVEAPERYSLDRFVINSGNRITATSTVRLSLHETAPGGGAAGAGAGTVAAVASTSAAGAFSNAAGAGASAATATPAAGPIQIERVEVGDGPIDASFKAINQIVGKKVALDDFDLAAVTEGKDAQGEARVRISWNGKKYNGRGVSTDIVEASIRAYIAAINVLEQGV